MREDPKKWVLPLVSLETNVKRAPKRRLVQEAAGAAWNAPPGAPAAPAETAHGFAHPAAPRFHKQWDLLGFPRIVVMKLVLKGYEEEATIFRSILTDSQVLLVGEC